LFVNSTIKKNAKTGGSGINQINVVVFIDSLPLHHVNVIRHNRVATAIDGDYEREADGHFRCRDREDDDREDLAGHLEKIVAVSPEGSQINIHRVEHQFDAKQDRDRVPARKHAEQADAEKRSRKNEIPGKWDHVSSPISG